jgi:hypothetical protein
MLRYYEGKVSDGEVKSVFGELVNSLQDCCSSVVVSHYCEKLVAEAQGQFRNPEEGGGGGGIVQLV